MKKGNIEIIFLLLVIILFTILLSIMYMLFMQINAYLYPIKSDLFYIVQNSIISLNKDDLSYYKYNINESDLANRVNNLLSKNHKNAKLDSIKYNDINNTVDIYVLVSFKPIVLYNFIGDINIKLHDNIKIKSMDVENEY